MRRECRERFPHHRGIAIPTCITARAWRTCRDVCRDRYLAVSYEAGGGENVSGIPGACATRNFTYLARGPWQAIYKQYTTQHFRMNVPHGKRHSVARVAIHHVSKLDTSKCCQNTLQGMSIVFSPHSHEFKHHEFCCKANLFKKYQNPFVPKNGCKPHVFKKTFVINWAATLWCPL